MVFKKIGEGVLYIVGRISPGRDDNIDDIIEQCYEKYFRTTLADFYHAICASVEDINRSKGRTQFKIPSTAAIKRVYNYHKGGGMTKEKFGKCVQELLFGESGLTGFGAKETLFYLFGVPVTALFLKNRIKPQSISDADFIPGVTSATVLFLCKFNKF